MTIEEHDMHSEFYICTEETARYLNDVKAEWRTELLRLVRHQHERLKRLLQIIMVNFAEASGWTNIFIYPGYEFKAIDGMITNFHLPKSTLIMLVSALAGREHVFMLIMKP